MRYQNQQFNQSNYERPQKKYRCGRQRFWQKACWQGPDQQGKCAGTTECHPVRRASGNRYHYECARPERAGGPCSSPNPDGSCSQQRIACRPQLSLGHWRKRFSYLSLIAIVAIIVTFSFAPTPFFQSSLSGSMVNPGPLSSYHATFASTSSQPACQNCHQQHNLPLWDWLLSAFQHQDSSAACSDCHLFEGPALSAHQKPLGDKNKHNSRIDVEHVECVGCHTEHKGSQANIVSVNNETCSVCHLDHFSDFAQTHPPFGSDYPYRQKQAIYFDHLKHMQEYFVDEQYLTPKRDVQFATIAAQSCTSCHEVAPFQQSTQESIPNSKSQQHSASGIESNRVKPKPYAQICQGCHDYQIKENQLNLFITDLELGELSPITLSLMDDEIAEDPDQAAETFQKGMLEGNMKSLFKLSDQDSRKLWLGLNPIEAQLAVKTWQSGESYAPEIDDRDSPSGWFMGENNNSDEALFYQASGHADPLLKAWIEQIMQRAAQNPDHEALIEARSALLEGQGPGACGKCHAAGLLNSFVNQQANASSPPPTAASETTAPVQWGYKNKLLKQYTHYNHRPHVQLMGEGEACQGCHQFDKKADVASYFKKAYKQKEPSENYQAAFLPISKQSCNQCHAENKISAECTTCHRYHGPGSYKIDFLSKPMAQTPSQPTVPLKAAAQPQTNENLKDKS